MCYRSGYEVSRLFEEVRESGDRVTLELSAEAASEVRPAIFDLAKSSGWTLYELHQETRSLEALFQQLTTGAAA